MLRFKNNEKLKAMSEKDMRNMFRIFDQNGNTQLIVSGGYD